MANISSRKALGRGLTNLIPIDDIEKGSNNEVVLIDSNSIKPNPFQPRKEFDQKEIEGLAESIKTQGLLQAIICRKTPDGYEIISGERRFRALKLLGEDKIPCIVKGNVTDTEMIEIALVENIQRENLNEIEEANAYKRLLEECKLSHEDLSKRVGKSRSTITNSLRLLKLPQEIQRLLISKEITMGHARAILSVEDPEKQKKLCKEIIEKNYSVREIEQQVKTQKDKKELKKQQNIIDANKREIKEKLEYKFGTKVNLLENKNGSGKIEINYYNQGDLNRILDLLLR
jgi:ParB family chromosome partitioning protein